jgi:hypothetical protein
MIRHHYGFSHILSVKVMEMRRSEENKKQKEAEWMTTTTTIGLIVTLQTRCYLCVCKYMYKEHSSTFISSVFPCCITLYTYPSHSKLGS